jgi:hypothetical protein
MSDGREKSWRVTSQALLINVHFIICYIEQIIIHIFDGWMELGLCQ